MDERLVEECLAPRHPDLNFVGEIVRIMPDKSACEALAEDHGGWNSSMGDYCGKTGSIISLGRLKSNLIAHVRFPDGKKFAWNRKALTHAGGDSTKAIMTGSFVRIIDDESKLKELQKGEYRADRS